MPNVIFYYIYPTIAQSLNLLAMKKVLFIASFALLVAGSLTSCCKTCTKPSNPSVQVCRDQYSSDQDYNNQIAWLQLAGYTCN